MPNEDFQINILLLIEDSSDDVLITQRKLFKSSLKIGNFLVAKNLTDGIKIVNENAVDVVLLDLNLPESKGLDTLVDFRQVYNGIIVVVTSLDDEMLGVDSIKHGADDYIVKSSMTENTLSSRIIFARERRKIKEHVESVKNSFATLDKIGK